MNELLAWCKQLVRGYDDVHVVDFSNVSFGSGMALAAILHETGGLTVWEYAELDPTRPDETLHTIGIACERLGLPLDLGSPQRTQQCVANWQNYFRGGAQKQSQSTQQPQQQTTRKPPSPRPPPKKLPGMPRPPGRAAPLPRASPIDTPPAAEPDRQLLKSPRKPANAAPRRPPSRKKMEPTNADFLDDDLEEDDSTYDDEPEAEKPKTPSPRPTSSPRPPGGMGYGVSLAELTQVKNKVSPRPSAPPASRPPLRKTPAPLPKKSGGPPRSGALPKKTSGSGPLPRKPAPAPVKSASLKKRPPSKGPPQKKVPPVAKAAPPPERWARVQYAEGEDPVAVRAPADESDEAAWLEVLSSAGLDDPGELFVLGADGSLLDVVDWWQAGAKICCCLDELRDECEARTWGPADEPGAGANKRVAPVQVSGLGEEPGEELEAKVLCTEQDTALSLFGKVLRKLRLSENTAGIMYGDDLPLRPEDPVFDVTHLEAALRDETERECIVISLGNGKRLPETIIVSSEDLATDVLAQVLPLLGEMGAVDEWRLELAWPSLEAPDVIMGLDDPVLASAAWTELEDPLYLMVRRTNLGSSRASSKKGGVAPLHDPFA